MPLQDFRSEQSTEQSDDGNAHTKARTAPLSLTAPVTLTAVTTITSPRPRS